MKKIVISISLLLSVALQVSACDICGCGVGSSYIGILPEFNTKIFGVRYRYSSLLTHIGSDGVNTYLTSREHYRTAELWGGWNITKNLRVMVTAPYNFNERINQGTTHTKSGIGDITLSGYYQLLNKRKTLNDNKLLIQSLWLGADVKLPSGKYNPADKESSNNNVNLFQLGTGSTDFIANAMYDLRLQDAGINATASYKINTTNKYDYTYGNKLNLSAQAYYKFRILNKLMLAPNAGIQYETAQKDLDGKYRVDVSGGNILIGTIGIETAFSKISIGANWQSPLSQKLANGFVKAGNRMMVHMAVSL
ncbi:MAG: transporter [Agriterribacter sp.]